MHSTKDGSKIKLIFWGTPPIAKQCLSSILDDDSFEVCAVVTQPDKPVGRSQVMTPSPVKELALSHGIPVYEPRTLRDPATVEELEGKIRAFGADYSVVVAYGQIMPKSLLNTPMRGSVNLHVSLLPKYRGASPMQEALKQGDSETGVTIQRMVEGLDHGDLLATAPLSILPDDTFTEVYANASRIGSKLLVVTLKDDFAGLVTPKKQTESDASYCTKMTKEDGRVDFTKMTAQEIYNLYRAYKEWPGVWTNLAGKKVLLHAMKLGSYFEGLPASFKFVKDEGLYVQCKEGALRLTELQWEGKKKVNFEDFWNGMRR